MRTATKWVFRVLLMLPPVLLLLVAAPRIRSGYAVDAVFPIPVYAVLGVPLPTESYRSAVDILSIADKTDGPTLLQKAELSALAGEPPETVAGELREGLSRSPWSTRGWMLLAEQLERDDPKQAGEVLTHSMLLGPYEFYLAERRSNAAAHLWNTMSEDGRTAALRQTRFLWTTADLNPQLVPLMSTPEGAGMVQRAFQDQPDELRVLNRWVAAARRGAPPKR